MTGYVHSNYKNRNKTSQETYSQTFENKSSVPPKPPGGLDCIPPILPIVVVLGPVAVAVLGEETGAALVQPPKSSSAVTVVGGFDAPPLGAPQPAPMSLAVSVSGTFIMEDAGGSAGAGSKVLHASPPKASKFDGNRLCGVVVALTPVLGADCIAGCGAGAGFDRLKADFNSSWGEATDGFRGKAAEGLGGEAAEAGGGEERPARSFAKDEGRLSG